MAVVQISQIIVRNDTYVTLPGIPSSSEPSPQGLAVGELGYATDTGQMFIGADPTFATTGRQTFPYHNIEVLTEFSPLINSLIARPPRKLEHVPVNIATPTGIVVPANLNGNQAGNGVTIFYVLIETASRAIRRGQLTIVTDGTQGPVPTGGVVESNVATTAPIQVSFAASVTGGDLSLMIRNDDTTPLSYLFACRIV